MNIAIMQPYFLPYIGYFQLISHVDRFVVYDRIKFTKKGWINRNRMLRNGEPVTFSIPVAKASDDLNICERSVASSFEPVKLANQISGSYRQAPYYRAAMPIIESLLHYSSRNLFDFVHHSIRMVSNYLNIATPILISSEVESRSDLSAQDRVLGLCGDMGTTVYTNPIGGLNLYDHKSFSDRGIALRFLRSNEITYPQFGNLFQPSLSILDLIMFNSPDRISTFLRDGYTIIEKDVT